SAAVRLGVALNRRCSKKCAAPATVVPSSREPTPTHTPTEADRTPGRCSVTTRNPLRVLRRIPPLAAALSAVGGGGIGGRAIGGVLGDQHQRDLAAVVDVGDLHPQL